MTYPAIEAETLRYPLTCDNWTNPKGIAYTTNLYFLK